MKIDINFGKKSQQIIKQSFNLKKKYFLVHDGTKQGDGRDSRIIHELGEKNLQSIGRSKINIKRNQFIYAHFTFIVTTFNARFIHVGVDKQRWYKYISPCQSDCNG